LFFHAQYTILTEEKVLPVVKEKRSEARNSVTFATKAKCRRFICTLSGQIVGLCLDDPDLGMDRIG
jgi:hypothetical protein